MSPRDAWRAMTGKVAMADGYPKDTDGKLHQAKGVVEPRDAPLGAPGGKVGIDKDIDLGGRKADHRRDHQDHDPTQAFIFKIEMRPPGKPASFQRRHLHGELQDPADQRPNCHADDRGLAKGTAPTRRTGPRPRWNPH